PFCYNMYPMEKDGLIISEPVGITYHVIPETDSICIDEIAELQYNDSAFYIPAYIEGKPVTQLGSGKPVIPKNRYSYIYIPETLKVIGDYAFMNCISFNGLSWYSSENLKLEHIGLEAFYGTGWQNSAESYGNTLSVLNILYRCFSRNAEYKVSDYYTVISADAFARNKSLEEIVLPDTLTKIEEGAFYDCTSLTSIEIPDSVVSIGNGAFVDCTALESAKLGSGLTEIGEDIFEGCTALKTIDAPAGSKAAEFFGN
ncbi:MAG: leucine-rich repeat domain-containing protein, partial [Oscillospiraceae bacterium]|nr:leucine-rich repeat domain-containing protein [Oscillospiraceae bacterium]